MMPAIRSVCEDLIMSCALFSCRSDNYLHAALSYSHATNIQVQENGKIILNKKEGEI